MPVFPDVPPDRKPIRFPRLRSALRRAGLFLAGVSAALLALLIYRLAFPPAVPLSAPQVGTLAAQALASATPPPAFSAQVYQAILPSLVLVQVKVPGTDGKLDDGLGSGVIIDASGDILTALHVVGDAVSIQVTFADGTQSSAQVGTKEVANDIAVLQAEKLPAQVVPAVVGNPNAMHVGDEAYVVGNPFGLYESMSAGIISGFGRDFEPPGTDLTLHNMIQVDTAVNPGNSGGPLLNRDGQVIGIVEGIVNPVGQNFFIGIGFAIPIDIAGGGAGLPPD